ncbi:flagellar hook capping FlgD N-terminal domain-containing protein [Paragemmobacter straminiformis]|uniref:Basal-body rod modification protein FlgD n=1 Tax=Paragemmobacter straminiformis TaxID=2045119 RepID=A0A842I9J7_9RHOB|nr:flagellar hook capping FlgD N-terminal domain-containing protein [Gemmobacter straminiformis]MBC2836093.1 flagellar hook assembly protein FlgD [Gemmobacter straminiformis]
MEIAQVTTKPTQTTKPAISADFDTFLKMLTVQMTNQDPMNPIEGADYAVQLATFSGVEQQVKTNQLLADLAAQSSLANMAQLAGWVGQEARSAAPVWFEGSPVTISPKPATTADGATLVVTDASGKVVSREEVPVNATSYAWYGADAAGDPLPPGKYTLKLESRAAGAVLRTDPVESYAPITEARRGPDGVELILRGGIAVKATDVTALRAP